MKNTLKTKELIKISNKLNWLKKDIISSGCLPVRSNIMEKILMDTIVINDYLF
jgi:hypothetical protein